MPFVETTAIDIATADKGMTFATLAAEPDGNSPKRKVLRKRQWYADGLLCVAAIVFVAAIVVGRHAGHGWTEPARAVAEAALIGGLADWYAIVALFRHPLGLPIWHTAIIPRKKDAIGCSLADFICDHFLDGEHITERIRAIDPARKLAQYLSNPESVHGLANVATELASRWVALLDSRELQAFVWQSTRQKFAAVDTPVLLAQLLDGLTRDGRHREAVGSLLNDLAGYVRQPNVREMLSGKIAEELWAIVRWVKLDKVVADNLAEKVSAATRQLIRDMAQDTNHPLRQQFDRKLPEFIDRLRTDEALRQKVGDFRDRLLANHELSDYVAQLCTATLAWIRTDIANPESAVRRQIANASMALGNEFNRRDDLRTWFNQWLLAELAPLADRYRDTARAYIVARVKAWSADELTDQLELNIGSELQWIRYNGTLVGAVIGALLYWLALAVRLWAG